MGRNSYRKRAPEVEAFQINYDEVRITLARGCDEQGIVGFKGDYLVIEDGEISIFKKENFEADYERKPYITEMKPGKLRAFTPPPPPPATVIYYGANESYNPHRRRSRTRKARYNNADGSSAYNKKDE